MNLFQNDRRTNINPNQVLHKKSHYNSKKDNKNEKFINSQLSTFN